MPAGHRFRGTIAAEYREGVAVLDRKVVAELDKVQDLPTLPQVIRKILEVVEDPDASANDLVIVLESDHSISARVLRWANSSFYGQVNMVGSIRRAVVVLGFDAVRDLALATSAFDSFTSREQFALDPEDFWMHSLGAAKATQLLCVMHCNMKSPSLCFTSALLHDIGKYVLALTLKDEYVRVAENALQSGRALVEVEKELLGYTHSDAGAWMLRKWEFPNLMETTILHACDAAHYAGPYMQEVALVALSSIISIRAGFGTAGDAGPPADPSVLTDLLGLSNDTVEKFTAILEKAEEQTREFFDLLRQS